MLKLQERLRALDVICEPGSEDFLAHSALSAAGGATWQLLLWYFESGTKLGRWATGAFTPRFTT